MSSIDFIEVVMAVEDSFGIEILDVDAKGFGGPRDIVDWLELRLIGKRINQRTAPLLAKLAELQGSPELGTIGWELATRSDCRRGAGSLASLRVGWVV
jgi:hypothetical protein